MDISKNHLLIVCSRDVVILDKITGEKLFADKPLESREIFGIKMLDNLGVVGSSRGTLCFIELEKIYLEGFKVSTQSSVSKYSSGIRDITHIEGDEDWLVIGSRSVIKLWNMKKMEMAEDHATIKCKVWMLTMDYPHVFVAGGSDWYGVKIYNIKDGKMLRLVNDTVGFHNIQSNGRFLTLAQFSNMYGLWGWNTNPMQQDNNVVVIYDLTELLDPRVQMKDLWSHQQTHSLQSWSQLNAVTNTTKMAVTYRRNLTIYDFWKDRDYDVSELEFDAYSAYSGTIDSLQTDIDSDDIDDDDAEFVPDLNQAQNLFPDGEDSSDGDSSDYEDAVEEEEEVIEENDNID